MRNGKREISLSLQLLDLRQRSPFGGQGSVNRDTLRWRYQIRPTPFSRKYSLDLSLKKNNAPRVLVRDPALMELSGGRRPPHTYLGEPPPLCLYRPKKQEWAPQLWLSETLLAWSGMWLVYFEDWLVTGEWSGGGEHPGDVAHD